MFLQLKKRLDIPLIFIVLLALFLNGYNIWTDHYVNTYYTTTVASMLQNFHNFFFGSLDSAGSVTVDKPPVAFWIQTISAYIFGLHGWSVILPQALAGIGSVLLIYFLVKPSFGVVAARLSALAFACTPIAAAVSRTNNIDSMLVFTLLLATWLLFKSVKRESVWSLLGSFAVIGIAFNMKMLQAYMILPAFYLFYLLAAKVNWKKKIGFLTGATAIMLVISLSWAVIVDSIPENKRPYIGSSETNSVLELAFGYNGISRLTGNQGVPGAKEHQQSPQNNMWGMPNDGAENGKQEVPADKGMPNANDQSQTPEGNNEVVQKDNNQNGANLPQGNGDNSQGFQINKGDGPPTGKNGGPGGMAGGMFGTGEKGPFRLFQSELSGQASWLLPFIVIASISLLTSVRRNNITLKHKEAVFWLAWLIPVMVFFSIAGFFHHYYLIMLAAPIAALFGAGSAQLFEDYKNNTGWKSWLLPIAVVGTAGFQWYIMHPYSDVIGAEWPLCIAVAGIIMTFVLVLFKCKKIVLPFTLHIAGLLILLIGPLYWAATPITYGGNSMLPQAGPSSADGKGAFPGAMPGFSGQGRPGDNEFPTEREYIEKDSASPEDHMQIPNPSRKSSGLPGSKPGGIDNESLDDKTFSYLKKNNTGEQYLFATTSYQTAAPYIIDEGESVITMGGFSGSDPVYSVEKLKELVVSGKVKYFLLSNEGMRGGSSEVTKWIQENGEKIPSDEWQTKQNGGKEGMNMGGPGRSNTLYKVTL
ncbi:MULTISPECIES: glycosyltransferase family 39 protein [Bacillus cereus group]|uniref:glycosyltransferase family 39 protein n=1 Tax=Bacillus cereus group TaxID=86661 RepID=UPI0004511D42|nr:MULTISPECIES: glycosyltransferase family 39 protein [Bacillus cereus group]EXY05591.1 4-amino-4-deoxy-L-arabinose transferase [Bacillus thuringiensis]MEB8637828.1 glycosyltransferase family 39 protein [Bacillus cereus]MEB8746601.1 glycosyltransferase family 39 protein [Bacillus cereus]MEB8797133.1 glycosyltransferase family 39 protein [Bacillus cereus]MEB8808718.1 glycosyltransferase family 39 protein [Bacillus cereus]